MDKDKANNLSETEQENSIISEQAGKQKSPDTMTAEELRKEILSTQASEPEEAESESVETPEEVPDDLKDKSQAELVKILVNLRKLKGRQDQELGELRKFKKQQEELQAQMEEQNLSASAQKMVDAQVKGMTPEERTVFYDKFAEDPEAALLPLIQKAMHPILIQQAKQNNEAVVKRLKESTKDSLVPYDEEGVNKIIASYQKGNRNELFDKYGSEAFQVAYDIYFKQNIETAVEKRLAEEREKLETNANPYVEPQGVSTGKTAKPTDYEKMSFEELRKLVGGTKL
jgi:uncharacterized phage infection (PIP) family protein YhgE